MVLFHKIREEHFELKAELKTFLFAINRNQWLKKLKSRHLPLPIEYTELPDNSITEEINIDLQQQQES